MRALPLCLLALSLTGCTLLPSKPSTTDNPIKQPPPVIERSPTACTGKAL